MSAQELEIGREKVVVVRSESDYLDKFNLLINMK